MAEETIVFTPGREMPPDILAQAQQMKPAGFTLQMMPARVLFIPHRGTVARTSKSGLPMHEN